MILIIPSILSTSFFDFISNIGYFRNVSMYASDSYNVISLGNFISGTLKRTLPVILLLYFFLVNKNAFYEISESPHYKVYVFGFSLYLSTYYSFPDISVRLSSYFIIFNILILPLFVNYFKTSMSRGGYIIGIFIYCLFSMFSYVNNGYYQYQIIDVF